jgi:hypothetical protein
MWQLDTFLYGLLDQAGFTEDDDLEQLHTELEETFLDKLHISILEQIPDEKREEASALLLGEDEAQRDTFINQYIPEYDDFLAQVCEDFADDYLDIMHDEGDIISNDNVSTNL